MTNDSVNNVTDNSVAEDTGDSKAVEGNAGDVNGLGEKRTNEEYSNDEPDKKDGDDEPDEEEDSDEPG